jgi:hypothetical protein
MKLGEALIEHGKLVGSGLAYYWFSRSWCRCWCSFWSLVNSLARNPNESVLYFIS